MEIDGLPLHILVVHAAVVLTPLAVAAIWAFALLPSWRWASRWAALGLTLVSTGAIVAAKYSGEAFLEARFANVTGPTAELIQTHQSRGNLLVWLMLGLAVIVVAAFLLLAAPSGLANGKLAYTGRDSPLVTRGVPVLLLVSSAVVLVWVVLTGDAGARAVWQQV